MAKDIQISKTLSYWLRHRPDAGGFTLSREGWAEVDAVLAGLKRQSLDIDREQLIRVVELNDKGRFELSSAGDRIRARQGHSVAIDGDWQRMTPPEYLFHGTVDRFMDSIMSQGLLPMKRHHVLLSPDEETARRVGSRRGSPVVLEIQAAQLAAAGSAFFLTANHVWLTDHVPPRFIRRI